LDFFTNLPVRIMRSASFYWLTTFHFSGVFPGSRGRSNKRMLPFEEDLELLDTIPGVARRTAETILAEIGSNMDQYPSAAHSLGVSIAVNTAAS